jgi:hypothetical protein
MKLTMLLHSAHRLGLAICLSLEQESALYMHQFCEVAFLRVLMEDDGRALHKMAWQELSI